MGVCTGFIVNPFLLVAIAFLAVILILLFRRRMEKGETPALPMSAGETGKKSPSEPPAAKPAEVPAVVEEEVGGVPALREYSFSKLNYLSVAGRCICSAAPPRTAARSESTPPSPGS